MTWLVVAAVAAFAVLFYLQTRDPMILLFGIVSAAMVAFVMHLVAAQKAGELSASVRVKCRACGGLNAEDAKHCSACGKGL